ncbi:MAG: leucine-rich repeat protein [Herbinix sp.]|nr:leucine-rich repeat protein [Herbinix sp.]
MRKIKLIITCSLVIFFVQLNIQNSFAASVPTLNNEFITNNSALFSSDASGDVFSISETQNGKSITNINLQDIICNNSKIQKLIIPEEISSITEEYFDEMDNSMLHKYMSLTPACPNLSAVEVDKDNAMFISIDGVLYSKDMTTLYYCPPGKEGVIVVPEGVKRIGLLAFQECAKLTSIQLPSTIISIDEAAFGGNSSLKTLEVSNANTIFKSKSNVIFTMDGEVLVAYAGGIVYKNYTIPKGVKVIRAGAFMGSSSLKKVTSNENLTTVGIEAFENCPKLKSVHFATGLRDIYAGSFNNCKSLTSINFPNGTRYIYEYALTGCKSLVTLKFPESVQELPSDLYKVADRVIKYYSPYCSGAVVGDIAKGIVVYGYKKSPVTTYLKNSGVTVKYFKTSYATISKAIKVPAGVVSGTGKADISWYDKSKKAFRIMNPDQLAGLAMLVNNGTSFNGITIYLDNDLDLSCYSNWVPIGKESQEGLKTFNGIFNGFNHTIYNLRINGFQNYQGLFGQNSGTIKNLIIDRAEVIGNDLVGILAGSSTSGTISNCTISGKVNGNKVIGGIVGQCGSIISSCSVNADVNGVKSIGGLVGTNYSKITDCSNKGNVNGFEQVGGFAGISYDGSDYNNCSNNMSVTGDINIGGLIGYFFDGSTAKDCINYGAVAGTENTGGIVGYLKVTIENCTNQGFVSGVYYVGGNVGNQKAGYIKNCKNEAAVAGTSGVGGVLGKLYWMFQVKNRVTDCTNTGKVNGIIYTDSIIGKDISDFKINQIVDDSK